MGFKSVALFCGSASGRLPIYEAEAQVLARALVGQGVTVLYGGGSEGLMGSVVHAVLAAGGTLKGYVSSDLIDSGFSPDSGFLSPQVFPTLGDRTRAMLGEADAVVCLPGGLGTLDELSHSLVSSQLGIRRIPIGILNTNGYYNEFMLLIDRMMLEGFIAPAFRSLFLARGSSDSLLRALAEFRLSAKDKRDGDG